MQGPDEDFRTTVAGNAAELETEDQLERLLQEIERRVHADVAQGVGENPEKDLAAIESWASVASYVSARFYAPTSPWPRSVAGWSTGAAAQLQSIANALSEALQRLKADLKAVSFSVGVNFPWGISIGFSW